MNEGRFTWVCREMGRAMPQYELRYLCDQGVCEIVDVPDPEEAEYQANQRLLFSEPGFAIAVVYEGVELTRVMQRSKAKKSANPLFHHARQPSGRIAQPAPDVEKPVP